MSALVEPPVAAEPVPSADASVRAVRPWWWVMLLSALVGIGSGTITIIEKIAILKDPSSPAFCDVNAQIGCTPVLLAPQSSVLGPPNAAIGIIMFGMFAAAGLAGVLGTSFPRSYRGFLLGLAVFFGLFLTWYMEQVAFAIGSLCPFCAVCAGCVMAIVLAAWRTFAHDVPADSPGLTGTLATASRAGLDMIVVAGWTALIAGMLTIGILA